jgi:hypothetical protein
VSGRAFTSPLPPRGTVPTSELFLSADQASQLRNALLEQGRLRLGTCALMSVSRPTLRYESRLVKLARTLDKHISCREDALPS